MAILGDGVKIAYSAASPQSWTEVTDLVDLPVPPAPVAERLENTTHGTNGYKTYGLGLKDVPEISATFYFAQATDAHLEMIRARTAGTNYWWRIEVPTNAAKTTFIAWEFQAYVGKADITTPIAGWQELQISLQYSGGYSFFDNAVATEIS